MSSKHLLAAIVSAMALAVTAMPATAAPKAGSKGVEFKAPAPGTVTVSDYEFNTFVMPAPIKGVYFPAGSPVTGEPIYLSNNQQIMLQFAKGADKPVQMVVELENGQVVTLRVLPRPVPGIVHAVNGARLRTDGVVTSPQPSGPMVASGEQHATPHGPDIELLKHLVSTGNPPEGFEPVALPRPARFDKFTVVPLSGWSDGVSKRVLVLNLVAVNGQAAVVSATQFYRPGITAVMLDGDMVDENTSPMLFVVEELNDE